MPNFAGAAWRAPAVPKGMLAGGAAGLPADAVRREISHHLGDACGCMGERGGALEPAGDASTRISREMRFMSRDRLAVAPDLTATTRAHGSPGPAQEA